MGKIYVYDKYGDKHYFKTMQGAKRYGQKHWHGSAIVLTSEV